MLMYDRLKAEKERNPDSLIIFHRGANCELWGSDAETVKSVLQLLVTEREAMSVVSFPLTLLPKHLVMLTKAGLKAVPADPDPEEDSKT